MRLHKATAKLGTVMLGLLAGVVREGFCTAETAEDPSDDGGTGKWEEAEGTVSTTTAPSAKSACILVLLFVFEIPAQTCALVWTDARTCPSTSQMLFRSGYT